MSQYILCFILDCIIHEVDKRQMREEEWQEWTAHVSTPFNILLNVERP